MPIILIVDDEPENLKSLKRFLEDSVQGWTILTARNEADAFTQCDSHMPDVVVTDLVMTTEQGGMDVLRHVKAKDPLAMVILITAFEKKLDRYRAFELGAFDCVQKNTPEIIAAEEILVKVNAALKFRELTLNAIKSEKRVALLRRYFDPQVFGIIEKNPDMLELKSKIVTIAFWDIRGFSRLCEILKAHPTLISKFLREYCDLAADVIFKNGGVLDKFIGDGVMGIFGSLEVNSDEGRQDAMNAVSAALNLRERFTPLLRQWIEQWKLYTPQEIDIGLGCGIHTGEVLVGNVGNEIRDQYTALGPVVNFAARLESRASKEQILVSVPTESRIKEKIHMTEAGIINDIKNIPGEFRLFSVLGKK